MKQTILICVAIVLAGWGFDSGTTSVHHKIHKEAADPIDRITDLSKALPLIAAYLAPRPERKKKTRSSIE